MRVISRAHGLAISLLLGTTVAAGAYALIGTAHLGDAETKPELVSSRLIAQRAHKLDLWQASLQESLRAKPPALPALNRYAAVQFVAPPSRVSLPALTPAREKAQPRPAATQTGATRLVRAGGAQTAVPPADPERRRPTRDAEPEDTTPVPVSAPVAAATPASSPKVESHESQPAATPPATATTPPATLSVEQQCRQILRAAEGKSEQVKQDAERQCEALKQAAEKQG